MSVGPGGGTSSAEFAKHVASELLRLAAPHVHAEVWLNRGGCDYCVSKGTDGVVLFTRDTQQQGVVPNRRAVVAKLACTPANVDFAQRWLRLHTKSCLWAHWASEAHHRNPTASLRLGNSESKYESFVTDFELDAGTRSSTAGGGGGAAAAPRPAPKKDELSAYARAEAACLAQLDDLLALWRDAP